MQLYWVIYLHKHLIHIAQQCFVAVVQGVHRFIGEIKQPLKSPGTRQEIRRCFIMTGTGVTDVTRVTIFLLMHMLSLFHTFLCHLSICFMPSVLLLLLIKCCNLLNFDLYCYIVFLLRMLLYC